MRLLKGMHEQLWQPVLNLMQCKIDRFDGDSCISGARRGCCSSVEPHADLMEHAGRVELARSVAQELQGRRDKCHVMLMLIRWQAGQAKGTNAPS